MGRPTAGDLVEFGADLFSNRPPVLGRSLELTVRDVGSGDPFAPPSNIPTKMLVVGRIRPDGTFRLTTSFASSGNRPLSVRVEDDQSNVDGYSKYFVVSVR